MSELKHIPKIYELIKDRMEEGDLQALAKDLEDYRPEDIAGSLNQVSEKELLLVFHLFDPEMAGDIIADLDPQQIKIILTSVAKEKLRPILEKMTPDEAVDILGEIKDSRRQELLQIFGKKREETFKKLLTYSPESAGGLMNPDIHYFYSDMTVAESIEIMRKIPEDELENLRIFVTDRQKKLIGRISLKKLVTSKPRTKLETICDRDVITVTVDMDQEEVARIAKHYGIVLLPVVEKAGKLLGLIAADSIMDVLQEEATEDMMRIVGSGEEELESLPILRIGFLRLPWLFMALVSGMVLSQFISSFSLSLSRIPLLASFIPICMALPGNMSSQSAMIMIRGLATGHIPSGHWKRFLLREGGLGMLLGFSLGLIAGSIVYFLNYDVHNSLAVTAVVSLSILVSMTYAALFGAFIPIVLKSLGLDPALGAGPFSSALNDIVGIVIYFNFANLIIL